MCFYVDTAGAERAEAETAKAADERLQRLLIEQRSALDEVLHRVRVERDHKVRAPAPTAQLNK